MATVDWKSFLFALAMESSCLANSFWIFSQKATCVWIIRMGKRGEGMPSSLTCGSGEKRCVPGGKISMLNIVACPR